MTRPTGTNGRLWGMQKMNIVTRPVWEYKLNDCGKVGIKNEIQQSILKICMHVIML